MACVARSCLAAFTEAAEPSWPRRKIGRDPLFGSHRNIVVYFTRYQDNMNTFRHCALREVACVARSCLAAFTEAAEPSWPRRKLGLSKADLVVLLLSANEASVDGSLKRPLKWSPFEVQKIVPLA